MDLPERYKWSDEELAALDDLSLTRVRPMEYYEVLWQCEDAQGGRFVVKSMATDSMEAKALRHIWSLPSPRNIAVPGRLLECSGRSIQFMPYFQESFGPLPQFLSWEQLLDRFYAMIDMVQFMHENNMAFIDIKVENMVYTTTPIVITGFNVPGDSVFFIDFGSARILPSGPGTGLRINDWDIGPGTTPPPEGKEALDPYAYDVFALGTTLKGNIETYQRFDKILNKTHIPRCLWLFTERLRVRDPLQRPPIFRVRRQFSALRRWMTCTRWTYKIFGVTFGDAFGGFGWKVLSIFVR